MSIYNKKIFGIDINMQTKCVNSILQELSSLTQSDFQINLASLGTPVKYDGTGSI